MGLSDIEDSEAEDNQPESKEELKKKVKMLEEELNQQRTLVSQLQKSNLALQTSKYCQLNFITIITSYNV